MKKRKEPYVSGDFAEFLWGFWERYGINLESIKYIDFDAVSDFNTMMKQLADFNIDLSKIQRHMEFIFDLYEKGIHLYDSGYKTTPCYLLEKDKFVDNELFSLENYIERFLLDEKTKEEVYSQESKYVMGNPYVFDKGECTKTDLACEILTTLGPYQNINNENIDVMTKKLIKRIYRKGGLVNKLKEDFGFDLNQFAGEPYEIEKCKIIYFSYALICKYLSVLQGKEGKTPNILKFLRNLSLENSGFVRFGYQPKNAKIVQFIKNSLEKELHIKKIAYIQGALEHVETAWHDYLDAVVFTIDNGKNIDVSFEFRLLEFMLLKSYKAVEANKYELSPIETFYLKFLQFGRLGELEDVKRINDISPDANNVVPLELVDRMKLWANTPILVDDVRTFIEDETAEIAQLVYLNMETIEDEQDEQDNIRKSEEQVIRMLEYCICVKPSLIFNDQVPKLRIVSCLQAILIDDKKATTNKKTAYTYYDFENNLSTHPPKIQDMPENDKDTINVQVRYWMRRMIDNWYANIGKSDLSCKLRELENKCCKILTEIYSCSSVSKMLSVHNDYYGKRYEIIESIFE